MKATPVIMTNVFLTNRFCRLPIAIVALLVYALSFEACATVKPQESASAAQFAISPYLFKNGSGSIMIGWLYADQAPIPKISKVDVYVGSALTGTVEGNFDGVVWTATLPIPECGYDDQTAYLVAGMSSKVKIAPNPCPNTGGIARFSFIADAQQGPQFVRELTAELDKFPGSSILSDGDLVQTGSDMSAWHAYLDALQPHAGSRVSLAAIGNHEYRSTSQTNYWQNFFQLGAQEAHYTADLGDVHLIVLNSNFTDDPSLIDSQLPWLKKELAKPAKWKMVMFHHPPYSIGFFNSVLAPNKEYVSLREKYVPLFESQGVDVVLNGHNHIFERSAKSGIQYLVAGPAGGKMGVGGATNDYSLKSSYQRTITHFEVTEHNLRGVTFTIDGHILDDFSIQK